MLKPALNPRQTNKTKNVAKMQTLIEAGIKLNIQNGLHVSLFRVK